LLQNSLVDCDAPVGAVRESRRAASPLPLEHLERSSTLRSSLESFIDARFGRAYGARLTHFCRDLLAVRDGAGSWQAAVGYTQARDGTLFLEQYLDAPVEVALARAYGRPVERASVVEVGNLAALDAGMARRLIGELARRFHGDGYRWAVFTATRQLRNSFRRLRLAPAVLARADRALLREGADTWGQYYSHDPIVMGGPIVAGLAAVRE
jgi:hypothetical protein